ncbi:MAG TPA: universal stress protein [Desulfuromonadales bacterium]|nr:universal stress protein [Desulfuromonadales bacterium]
MTHKILVAVDGSGASERALEYAAKMARDLGDAQLTIFHVGEPIPVNVMEYDKLPGKGEWDEKLEKHRKDVEKYEKKEAQADAEMFRYLKHRAEQQGLKPEQVDTRFSADVQNIPTEIILAAEKGGYEAICLGRQGRSSVKEFFIGSVSERVVRHARGCAVWVVE